MVQTRSPAVTTSCEISCFQIGEFNPQLQKITDILDSIKEKVKLILVHGWLTQSLFSAEFSDLVTIL